MIYFSDLFYKFLFQYKMSICDAFLNSKKIMEENFLKEYYKPESQK